MKTIRTIINKTLCGAAALAVAIGAASCDDLLDTKPQGVFTAEQIGESEALDLMTSAYATMLCHYFGNNESFAGPINNWVIDLRSDDALLNHYFGNNESFAGPINNWVFDVRSDDALKGGDGVTMEAYMHQLEIGNVQSDNDVINFKWRNNYFSISRCNTAIKAILSAGSLSDETKESFVAEMKTLRAYYYFDMLRLFEKFPYFDETVANPSECRADEYTRDQIASFIRKDLKDAYHALPETQAQVGRFNKYVAAAVLARVDLFLSEWAEASEYAGYVIDSDKYHLYNNFLDMSNP